MSQYLNFYIRTEDDKCYLIATRSANSLIYSAFNTTYGRGEECGINKLDAADQYLKELQDTITQELKSAVDRYNAVTRFNNPVDEKLEALYSLEAQQKQLGDEMLEAEHERAFIAFLREVIDCGEYGMHLSPYLMMGIEWNGELDGAECL